ncbi:MAG: hypothetical protein ABII00_09395 [Elusimicrobiota bacterium]
MRFRRYGRTRHLVIESVADLRSVLKLNEAHWVATGAPVEAIYCDKTFLRLVDADGDGRLLCGDIRQAIEWTLACLREEAGVVAGSRTLSLAHIDGGSEEGRRARDAAARLLSRMGRDGDKEIALEQVRGIKAGMEKFPVSEEGVVLEEAAETPELKAFLADVLATVGGAAHPGGKQGVGEEQLAKFLDEAKAYLGWQERGTLADGDKRSGIMPLGPDTAPAYALLRTLGEKVDQYFAQCRFLVLDGGVDGHFGARPGELEKLDLADRSVLEDLLKKAPLSRPRPERILAFAEPLNPHFEPDLLQLRKRAIEPALGRAVEELSEGDWRAVRAFFAEHGTWEEKKAGAVVEPLGLEKLRAYLGGKQAEGVRKLIARGRAMAAAMDDVRLIEKLILYQAHLLSLANNFVSFPDLYVNDRRALFEAGTLVMDGRRFCLAVRVRERAGHVKVAEASQMFVMYVEVDAKQDGGAYEVAIPVTSGGRGNLCVGKRGLFWDLQGRERDARVVHIIENPIGFGEAIVAPFGRLGRTLMGKIESITGGAEKKLDSLISGGASPAVAIGGIMMGTAALGSAAAFITKTLAGVALYKVLAGTAGAVFAVVLPAIAAAFFKLRRRDLAAILEASGWAINARMRMTYAQGRFFTHRPERPG